MRDMTAFYATLIVAQCYNIRSKTQGARNAETAFSHDKTHRAWFAVGPADHGAAGPAGSAMDAPHHLGAARGPRIDITRVTHRLRPGLADHHPGPAVRAARDRSGRAC